VLVTRKVGPFTLRREYAAPAADIEQRDVGHDVAIAGQVIAH
jgi:hypothetical protein